MSALKNFHTIGQNPRNRRGDGGQVAQTAMALLEQRLQRYLGLEKYFVLVHPLPIPLPG